LISYPTKVVTNQGFQNQAFHIVQYKGKLSESGNQHTNVFNFSSKNYRVQLSLINFNSEVKVHRFSPLSQLFIIWWLPTSYQ